VNDLIPFDFEKHNVRVVILDGAEWWVGKDVCQALEYRNPADAMKTYCRGVANRYPIVDSLGRKQEVRIINESDLFRLIIASHMPEAQRFERWVFEVVLPQIRKTGSYGIAEKRLEALESLVARLSEEKELREENERLKRSRTRPTPREEREILELRRQGDSKTQIRREVFRGIHSINRILKKCEGAMDQMGLFDEDESLREMLAASRGKGGAV
jgi:prophage antirepressor-like protein